MKPCRNPSAVDSGRRRLRSLGGMRSQSRNWSLSKSSTLLMDSVLVDMLFNGRFDEIRIQETLAEYIRTLRNWVKCLLPHAHELREPFRGKAAAAQDELIDRLSPARRLSTGYSSSLRFAVHDGTPPNSIDATIEEVALIMRSSLPQTYRPDIRLVAPLTLV